MKNRAPANWFSKVFKYLDTAHGVSQGSAIDFLTADVKDKRWRLYIGLKITSFAGEVTKLYLDYKSGKEAPND